MKPLIVFSILVISYGGYSIITGRNTSDCGTGAERKHFRTY